MSYQALNLVIQIRLLGAKAPNTPYIFWNAHRVNEQAQTIMEQLTAENALEWAGRMNNIRACSREIVTREIIFA